MLGDLAPIFGRAHPLAAAAGSNSVRLPWVRGYKMADNQTPWPVDRVFFAFNYYDDINIGQAAGNTLHNVKVYREFFGAEKTFLDDRNASIGLRLPLNTLSATSTTPGLGGRAPRSGDLTVYGKYAFGYDREQGRVNMVGSGGHFAHRSARVRRGELRSGTESRLLPALPRLRPFGRPALSPGLHRRERADRRQGRDDAL